MQSAHSFLFLSVIMMLSLISCRAQPVSVPVSTPTSEPSLVSAASPVLETVTGSFRNQISLLEHNMPRSKSEAYVFPTAWAQSDFADLVSRIMANDLPGALDLAKKNRYELDYYVDRGDHYATSYLLREQRPIEKGWGLYALRMDSNSKIIVEAPHPLYDRKTPTVALDLYRALQARALLIAGAHRNANQDKSADVAHAAESVFQSVHIALAQEIQNQYDDVIILQIHGFHSTKHEGYPEVVLGLGEDPLPKEVAVANKIKEALAAQGIRAGICTGVESNLEDLCAKTNIQSSVTKEGCFIHVELDENLRKDDTAFVAALVQALAQ